MLIPSLIAGILVVAFVAIYNSLIQRKNDTDACWGAIDAYLKKRFDLIPNLVASVKQYMEHERATLETLVNLRERALSEKPTPELVGEMDSQTTHAVRVLMARAEAYPELRSNQNFIQLQTSLSDVEEQLSAARRAYNSSVREYNNGIEMIPYNWVAGLLRFRRKEMFVTLEAEKVTPNVTELFVNRGK